MSQFKKILITILLCISFILSSIPDQPVSAFSDSLSFILISQHKATLDIGDELALSAFTSNGRQAKWKSSNAKVASVNTYGVVTAKNSGSAVITARITNAEATCYITVNRTKVSISTSCARIERGEAYLLSATVSTAAKVTWKSSRKSIATVDENGLVTGRKPGETIITAAADKTEAVCTMIVKAPTVKLSRNSISLYRGQFASLSASVSSHIIPSWKTNKKSVATVDASGNITAVKNGTAVITATVDGISDSCQITVRKPDILFSEDQITLRKGECRKVTVSVSSGNSPIWSSSNTNVVTVDSYGRISAKQKGKAYLYAAEDGTKARCTIYVTE